MEAGNTDLRKAIQTNITNTKKQKQKKKRTKESRTRIKGRRKKCNSKVNASVRKNFGGEEQRAAEKRCEEKRDDSENVSEESRSKTSCKPAMAHYIVASERGSLPRAARASERASGHRRAPDGPGPLRLRPARSYQCTALHNTRRDYLPTSPLTVRGTTSVTAPCSYSSCTSLDRGPCSFHTAGHE